MANDFKDEGDPTLRDYVSIKEGTGMPVPYVNYIDSRLHGNDINSNFYFKVNHKKIIKTVIYQISVIKLII
jgi:hypothetical protein